MPIAFDQMNAKTSNYQDNGPLNALVHALVAKQANGQPVIQPNAALQREFSQAFYDEWGTYLSLQQLANIVERTTDPMHREMLLGPVLRRMSAADEGEQGDSGSAEVSVEAVAKLGKRFGIRVESYKTPEGIKAEIKEALLKSHPQLADPEREETLKRLVGREFGIITNNPADPRNPGAEGLKDFLTGTNDRVEEGGVGHHATLRLLRKDKGYRFQAINHGDNANLIITADHNSSQGYKTPCDYAQAAPVLREQLRATVTTAVAAADDNNPARQNAMRDAMRDKTSEIFSAYQAGPAKASKTGDAAKGGLNGMMDGLLGRNVSTFFGEDVFGSLKGIMGMLGGIFEPIMKMLMGFQETMSESAKQPGDAFSKKEMEEYSKSEELGKAAKDFLVKVQALSEGGAELYEKWRANPDSTEAWVDLIETLVTNEELVKADKCLREQEERLLKTLEGLKADHQTADGDDDAQALVIVNLMRDYHAAVDPLENSAFRANQKSIEARLAVFEEISTKVQALSKTHSDFKDKEKQRQQATAEENILQAEQAAAGVAAPAGLAGRLRQVQLRFNALNAKVQELTADNLVTPIAPLFANCARTKRSLVAQEQAVRHQAQRQRV